MEIKMAERIETESERKMGEWSAGRPDFFFFFKQRKNMTRGITHLRLASVRLRDRERECEKERSMRQLASSITLICACVCKIRNRLIIR